MTFSKSLRFKTETGTGPSIDALEFNIDTWTASAMLAGDIQGRIIMNGVMLDPRGRRVTLEDFTYTLTNSPVIAGSSLLAYASALS